MTEIHAGLPDKRQVAASFSRAATTYDSVAAFQRGVGEHLLSMLPPTLTPRLWLDLGSGTGHFSRRLDQCFTSAQGLALDIAEGMLAHARGLGGAVWHVAADAENLPLHSDTLDLVFSSLALQWCGDFRRVLTQVRDALKPRGHFAFSSLCTGTLAELRSSWEAADGQVHVNRFRAFETYHRLCAESGLKVLELECRPWVLHYPDVRGLTHELKALGAHNLNPGRPGGLTGRARVAAMMQAYERWRTPAGLPATYQVVYGVLRKA
ncbi:malonyl-ACP O-methyltransferase BioC [Pseudomonas massiliensis]|uniref:malonyl-ACP O-methyltransferase BioC n=1 Tax=Pseudomonas massiliensis TaxID=522492 RepID=UPI00058EB280|nr:malonyl-ACP O-methyltransferase BioC [Pseudomonas massiliensis]